MSWKPDVKIDHKAQQLHFSATLRVYAMLTDEQISQAIYELRNLHVGVENTSIKAENKNTKDKGTTTLKVVVRSREHLEEAIQALRQVLGYANIQRLYQ